MKTLSLLLGAFAIILAAIIAGRFATAKQAHVFPRGSDIASARTAENHTKAALPEAAQNTAAPLKNGETGTMPQLGMAYGDTGHVTLEGCLLREDGKWLLRRGNEHEYTLAGDLSNLQSHRGRWVRLDGLAREEMPQADTQKTSAVFEVQKLEETGPDCDKNLPVTVAVPGEAGNKGFQVPITTTQSVGQPTSGAMTSTGRQQQPGKQVSPAEQQTPQPQQPSVLQGAPPNPNLAGQSPFDAERASEAVHRAHEAARRAAGEQQQPSGANSKQGEMNPKQ